MAEVAEKLDLVRYSVGDGVAVLILNAPPERLRLFPVQRLLCPLLRALGTVVRVIAAP